MNIPNLNNIKGLVKVGKAFVLANRPELLFGTSIIATIGSVGLAAKGGYEARGLVDAEIRRHEQDPESSMHKFDLTLKEKAALTWRCYIPAGVALTTAVGSTTGLHIVHVKGKKAMAAGALMAIDEAKEAAQQYRNELIGVASEEKGVEVDNKIHEGRADKDGISRVINSDGEIEELYLVRDERSGRDIWSNQHRIEDAVIEVNNVISGSDGVELNHFYRHAGFSTLPDGINYGWSGALVSLEWGQTVRDDGRPVRSFRFRPAPAEGYDA